MFLLVQQQVILTSLVGVNGRTVLGDLICLSNTQIYSRLCMFTTTCVIHLLHHNLDPVVTITFSQEQLHQVTVYALSCHPVPELLTDITLIWLGSLCSWSVKRKIMPAILLTCAHVPSASASTATPCWPLYNSLPMAFSPHRSAVSWHKVVVITFGNCTHVHPFPLGSGSLQQVVFLAFGLARPPTLYKKLEHL